MSVDDSFIFSPIEFYASTKDSDVYTVVDKDGTPFVVKMFYNNRQGINPQAIRELNGYGVTKNLQHLAKYEKVISLNDHIYIVMPMYDGDLSEYVMEPKQAKFLCEKVVLPQLCQAVDELHSLGIVHLDIKPTNIFVKAENIYLADFGLISLSTCTGDPTINEVARGTVPYIAPEVYDGQITKKADYVSVGITLLAFLCSNDGWENYQTLCELYPKNGDCPIDVARVLADYGYDHKTMDGIINAIEGMLMKDPNKRVMPHQTMLSYFNHTIPIDDELRKQIIDLMVYWLKQLDLNLTTEVVNLVVSKAYDCSVRYAAITGNVSIMPLIMLANCYGENIGYDTWEKFSLGVWGFDKILKYDDFLDEQLDVMVELGFILSRCEADLMVDCLNQCTKHRKIEDILSATKSIINFDHQDANDLGKLFVSIGQ